MAFIGTYEMIFDPEGRIIIPHPYVKMGRYIVESGMEWREWVFFESQEGRFPYLVTYPYDRDYDLVIKTRTLKRATEIDRENRIYVAREARAHIGIYKDSRSAIFVGIGKYFELWEQSAWNEYMHEYRRKIERANQEILRRRQESLNQEKLRKAV